MTIVLRLPWLARSALLFTLAALAAIVAAPVDHTAGSMQVLTQAAAVALLAAALSPRPAPGTAGAVTTSLAWGTVAALSAALLLILRLRSRTDPGTVAALAMGVGVLTLLAGSLQVGLGELLGDRRLAARLVLLLVLVLGATPLWLGPVAELLARDQAAVDGVVALSPLSYLAALAEVDYLRSDWFYRHTSFGSLRYAYPSAPAMTAAYLALAAAALSLRRPLARRSQRAPATAVPHPSTS